MNGISFTIVIPTYQRRELVLDAVRSLALLEYGPAPEVIVVVDGSSDGTAYALQNLKTDLRLKVLTQPNAGAASARNRGAREATGEVILFLDDDMEADRQLLAEHARALASGADAIVGHIPLHPRSRPGFLSEGVSLWAEERRARLLQNPVVEAADVLTGQLSVRRTVFNELGGFDEAFTRNGAFGNEDTDLGIRLVERGGVVFNARAISWQKYMVGPKAYLRQWYEAGSADVMLARKHPLYAGSLFRPGGRSSADRPLVVLAARAPGVSTATSAVLGAIASAPALLRTDGSGLLARIFYVARDLAYWRGVAQARRTLRRPSLTVLCYHAIADLSADPVLRNYAVPPDDFEAQLDGLVRRGFHFISGDDFARYLAGQCTLPRRSVLMTFDDCYVDLVSVAAPRLMARGCPAIAFAVTGIPSSTNEWDQIKGAARLELLRADGLHAAAGANIEIGAHSRTHRPLTDVGVDLNAETVGAAIDLTAMGLPRPRYFAYPYGRLDDAARDAVHAASYRAAFALTPRRFGLEDDPMAVPRIEILRRDRGMRFFFKTEVPELYVLLTGLWWRMRRKFLSYARAKT